MRHGILYGIGVGPGDPDLITLAAIKALAQVEVVFTPASSRNDFSLALDIIGPHLRPEAELRRLDFPMTRDDAVRRAARMDNARAVVAYLDQGRAAAFITLGDPLIYSTFGHLLRGVHTLAPQVEVRVIPGITSYQAASARLGTVLVEGDECLVVASGHAERHKLATLLAAADAAVVLKPAKKMAALRELLRDSGALPRARLVERCGLPEEAVYDSLDKVPEKLSYFSLLHIAKAAPSGDLDGKAES